MGSMGTLIDRPLPESVRALLLAADDCLVPTPALRLWRDKPIFKAALSDTIALVRASDRDALIMELNAIGSYLAWKIRQRKLQGNDELDQYLAEKLLEVWLGDRRYRAVDEINGRLQGRAYELVPELSTKKTEEELFLLDDDLTLGSHYAMLGDMAIPPSVFLRRYYGATPNFVFLRHLGTLASEHPECSVAVALNTAHCASVADTMHIFEEDYWYGPPFSLQRLDDPKWVGVTRHWTPPPGEPLHYPVAATEFVWQLDSETFKSLQIEETYYPWDSEWDPQDDQPWFINRYVHSTRDIAKRRFVHLDGAVKLFDKTDYNPYERRPKRSALHYKKLFRVDGRISDDDWMQLVAHYLRGNDHLHEYFGEVASTT
jgi:hypothetical protein